MPKIKFVEQKNLRKKFKLHPFSFLFFFGWNYRHLRSTRQMAVIDDDTDLRRVKGTAAGRPFLLMNTNQGLVGGKNKQEDKPREFRSLLHFVATNLSGCWDLQWPIRSKKQTSNVHLRGTNNGNGIYFPFLGHGSYRSRLFCPFYQQIRKSRRRSEGGEIKSIYVG